MTLLTIAQDNHRNALAMVAALEEQLDLPKRERRRPLRSYEHSVEALEAVTQELEFRAIDLAHELEARDDADLVNTARAHSAQAQREEMRHTDPVGFLLARSAEKAERVNARKAAMAAWQTLRAAQKEDYVPSEKRTKLPAHFDQLPTLGYQSLAERYSKQAAEIREELEYFRHRRAQGRIERRAS